MLVQNSHPSDEYTPLDVPGDRPATGNNQIVKDYLSLAKNTWRNSGANSPQIMWVKWNKDKVLKDYRMLTVIRFKNTYGQWYEGHTNDDTPLNAYWDIHYPAANYRKYETLSHRYLVHSRTLTDGAPPAVTGVQGTTTSVSSRFRSKLPHLC